MKKYLSLLLVIMLVVLCACGGSATQEADETVTVSESSVDTSDEVIPEEPEEASLEPVTGDLAFSSVDIDGNEIDGSVFAGYDLTMVNVFATWCPPCVAEMPELAQLYKDMEPQGVNIVGFVLDTRIDETQLDEAAIEAAKNLREQTGVTYPCIIPDETFLNWYLIVEAVPTTYFVDNNGNIVGEPVVGSNSYDGWKGIIEERLSAL